jgi:hypothetical protein
MSRKMGRVRVSPRAAFADAEGVAMARCREEEKERRWVVRV